MPSYRHAAKPEPEPFKLLIEIDEQNQWAKLNRAVAVRKTLFLTIETFTASHLASLLRGLAPEDYDLLRAKDLQKAWDLEEQSTVRRRIPCQRQFCSVLTDSCHRSASCCSVNLFMPVSSSLAEARQTALGFCLEDRDSSA